MILPVIQLQELSANQVVGLNNKAVVFVSPHLKGQKFIRDLNGLEGCLKAIFYQSHQGYMHLPLEKMAGLILYRVAQGQYFLDGNKRTALLSTVAFLHNNGLKLRVDRAEVRDLLWNFAPSPADPLKGPKYVEADSIKFVEDNVLP